MPVRLLFVLLLLPHLAFASPNAERLQAIRSQAFSTCSSLLVHYNPNQNDSDPRHAERYRQTLQQLQRLVTLEKDPLLIQYANDMREHIEKLEHQSANTPELYPTWINPLLEAQSRLDQQASVRYASATPIEPRRKTLHQLALDIERLQLLYQTRTFGSLAVYVMPMDDTTFAQLDQQILQNFSALKQDWPEHAAELNKLLRKYDFIRPRLLKHELVWVPGSAAYYLGQVTDGLARINAE
ncbi:MAG TPA: hypothetical protein VFF22_16650 [Pseudomonas sp.]|nr:hypothetical protein [Pseudomonas sp.]